MSRALAPRAPSSWSANSALLMWQEKLTEDQRVPGVEAAPDGSGTASGQAQKAAGGKYVPPSLRDGANRTRGETMSTQRKGERLDPLCRLGVGVWSSFDRCWMGGIVGGGGRNVWWSRPSAWLLLWNAVDVQFSWSVRWRCYQLSELLLVFDPSTLAVWCSLSLATLLCSLGISCLRSDRVDSAWKVIVDQFPTFAWLSR